MIPVGDWSAGGRRAASIATLDCEALDLVVGNHAAPTQLDRPDLVGVGQAHEVAMGNGEIVGGVGNRPRCASGDGW